MSLAELVPSVRALPRPDKLRLMHLLLADLAHEEGVSLLVADGEQFPVWSPYAAFDAADALLRELEAHKAA